MHDFVNRRKVEDMEPGCEFAHLFPEALEAIVANELGEGLSVGSVGADIRQSQHNVHLLSSTIVRVKHEAEIGNTHSQQVFAINSGKYWGYIEECAMTQGAQRTVFESLTLHNDS